MNQDYSSISPTAKLTAYLRSETDIPFSKEISKICHCEEVVRNIFGTDNALWKAPKIEARYKALSAVLNNEMKKRDIMQVLELASGILPRGIIMSEDVNINYIETDLEGIIKEKRQLITFLDLKIFLRKNLKLQALNVTIREDFHNMTSLLVDKPVVIINEGLLAYLSIEEKKDVAKNIHEILKQFGGVWITPDISNSGGMKRIAEVFPEAVENNQRLGDIVKRDMKLNSIGNKEEAVRFYENIGFKVSEYSYADLDLNVTSLNKITDKDKREVLSDILQESFVWVLEAE